MICPRLSGYHLGMVQIFLNAPCPEILARYLLSEVLDDFYTTAQERFLMLAEERIMAIEDGESVSTITQKLKDHLTLEQTPDRWLLHYYFSDQVYADFGRTIFPFWSAVLIQLCVIEQHWDNLTSGRLSPHPCLSALFHEYNDVYDPTWERAFHPIWFSEVTPSEADCRQRCN